MRRLLAFTAPTLLLGIALPAAAHAQGGLDIFVTPVPDAPFVAIVNVQRTLIQKDGTFSSLKTMRGISRDRQGRIYNEMRQLVAPASTETPPLLRVHIYDPVLRVSTILNPADRTFRNEATNRPPATEPPALLQAAPTGARQPQRDFVKEEDLGVREMEGLQVHGVRDTQTLGAAQGVSTKPVIVTDEFWYSDDLRMNLVIKHNDPRTGSVTMTVSNISRTDPDPSLFQVPEGYTPFKPETTPAR